jgi:hypothetical protein
MHEKSLENVANFNQFLRNNNKKSKLYCQKNEGHNFGQYSTPLLPLTQNVKTKIHTNSCQYILLYADVEPEVICVCSFGVLQR